MATPGRIETVFLPVNVNAPQLDVEHLSAILLGAPLQDPRSHPLTRTAGEGLVTAGRGQAPNAATSAGRSLRA